MTRSFLLAAAALLAFTTAQAQTTGTKIKTKTKSDAAGAVVKSKTEGEPVVLDGPIKRVETLSGIDVYPDPNKGTIFLSFTQQFTKPGTLVMTNYKKQEVYSTPLDPLNNTGAPVDLGRIPAGTYLVEAKTGNYVYWKKVNIKYPSSAVVSSKKKKKLRY
ncbi:MULTISPECIES: T9SS type A sorting domain-containing protein [Hymenobacter]|uniref:T9SS type A sorting domain-containing protein n=1 Tax=Hymenobacter jejuensis TaxID=2502781 RepID=A0A5B7ZXI3_9BACT|nr:MULTISPECIES: T9SS type A sorting domain-containing protein [Hymenobacter]MBC6992475.1 T9SS type A sorting domain-containing protein [Hymenobacter sp. BT491]QDA59587.1 T9SS type A sorting domain-containing protein [Hymenobacter jejuensis]